MKYMCIIPVLNGWIRCCSYCRTTRRATSKDCWTVTWEFNSGGSLAGITKYDALLALALPNSALYTNAPGQYTAILPRGSSTNEMRTGVYSRTTSAVCRTASNTWPQQLYVGLHTNSFTCPAPAFP